MKKRTAEQWQTLISQFEASGLTQTAFCVEQKICRKHFGKYRTQILSQSTLNTKPSFVPVTLPARYDSPMLELHQANVLVLKIPLSISPTWLAELIHQLQA